MTNSSDYMSYIVSLMNKRNTSSNQAVKKCSISSDKNSISITEGNSDSVMLSLSGSCKISAYTDTKGIVSISKGSCQNGKINVTFKGISAGSVNVKFVPSCDKSVYCTVNVTVNSVNEDIEEDITDNSSSCTDGSCGTVNPSTDTSSSSSCSEYASQVLYYVNEARKDEGLSPLSLDANLCSAANLRAQEISSYFSHTRPNGSSWSTVYSEFGCKYSYSGENIAAGNSTAKATVDQWLASPGHRANILNKNYTKLGVGYFYSANSDYGYYWAQDFGG